MASPALLDIAAQYFENSPAPQLESAGASNKGQRKGDSKRSLDLRGTVIVGEMPTEGKMANSVFKMQRQLFARSERVKGIDFHPVEPWILTTLYSGMFALPVCRLESVNGGRMVKGKEEGTQEGQMDKKWIGAILMRL